MKVILEVIMVAAVIAGCDQAKPQPQSIRDLKDLKQDALAYVDPDQADLEIISAFVPELREKIRDRATKDSGGFLTGIRRKIGGLRGMRKVRAATEHLPIANHSKKIK